MTVTFLSAGTSETFDTSIFNATVLTNGAVASSASNVHNQQRSLKCTGNTGGNTRVAKAQPPIGVINNNGRGSFYVFADARASSFSNGSTACDLLASFGNATTFCFGIALDNNGKLRLLAGQAGTITSQVTGATTLAINTFYHISFAWSVTSANVNSFRVWLNGVLELTINNIVGLITDQDRMTFGIDGWDCTSSAVNAYFTDMYLDGASILSDPGDIRVTAKRPISNGTTNQFTTQIGVGGSGVGSGHAPQVNERALSQTNGWSITPSGSTRTEEYNIEAASAGDVDITGMIIMGVVGWIFTKTASSLTNSIIVDGTLTNIANTTTAKAFRQVSPNPTTYPAGTGSDIGMRSTTTASLHSLYECGITIAYIAPITATPGVNGLTVTAFAPTSAAPRLVIPPKLALTTTLYTPVDKLSVSPGVKSVAITEYSPTILGPQSQVPDTLTLSLSEPAPDIRLGLYSTPGTDNLNLTEYGPVPGVSYTPGVKVLTLSEFSIVASAPLLSTIGKLGLTLSPQMARFGLVGVPGVRNLLLSRFAPKPGFGPSIPTLTMTTTRFQITLLAGQTYSPGKLSLLTTKFAPIPGGPRTAVPDTVELNISAFDAAIHPGPNVSPDTLSLALTEYGPVLTFFVTPRPNTKALVLTRFAPKAMIPKTATPGVVALLLSRKTILPHVGQSASIGKLSLLLSEFSPLTSAGVVIDRLSLLLSEFSPTGSIGYRPTPGVLSLNLALKTIGAGLAVKPSTLALVLAFFAPTLPRALRPISRVQVLRTRSQHGTTLHRGIPDYVLRRNRVIGTSYNKIATPAVKHLLTASFAPKIIIGIVVTPDTYPAILTRYNPATLSVEGPNAPNPATLVLTGISVGSFTFTITPGTKALNLTAYVLG